MKIRYLERKTDRVRKTERGKMRGYSVSAFDQTKGQKDTRKDGRI